MTAKKKLHLWMLVNDLFMALNFYEWWFHGDAICGFVALLNFAVLVLSAFVYART